MYCKTVWDQTMVNNAMGFTFLKNEYKDHRRDVLLEREKGKIPATQNKVLQEKEVKILRNNSYHIVVNRTIRTKISELNTIIWSGEKTIRKKDLVNKRRNVKL